MEILLLHPIESFLQGLHIARLAEPLARAVDPLLLNAFLVGRSLW
jgi:hypothetical protein